MEIDDATGPRVADPQGAMDKEKERKQRNREYRVAARREKRNRKADEKKQRKLNATILRRMTRNPEKYNKNAARNRLRVIEMERRKIWLEATRQAQRLAAIHDPSGASFNVAPVVTLDDGSVITQDALLRRREREAGKAKAEQDGGSSERRNVELENEGTNEISTKPNQDHVPTVHTFGVNAERQALMEGEPQPQLRSKTQLKKMAKFIPRPAPPRPTIPEGISVFGGEEDWLSLWDLEDQELERRVAREKKRKAAARKALRLKQQSGKAERRMARDEKRRVYRDLKLEWRNVKEATTRERMRLRALEDQESKKIATYVSDSERQRAMEHCVHLGFTLQNTEGVDDVKPRALGMKGLEVDVNAIEKGDGHNEVVLKRNSKRIDLSGLPEQAESNFIPPKRRNTQEEPDEFIPLDVGEGEGFQRLDYNHKVRRKLRRAIEHAEIEKELLVRRRALDHYQKSGIDPPAILNTNTKAINVKGHRILENGTLETAKQERVRMRIELADFNDRMRVLRRQAKEKAIFEGLRKYAEVTGRIPAQDGTVQQAPQSVNIDHNASPGSTSSAISKDSQESASDSNSSSD